MKLQSIKKAQRIYDLNKINEDLRKDIAAKEAAINRMLDNGVTEYAEKGQKPVKLVLQETSVLETKLVTIEGELDACKKEVELKDTSVLEYHKENKELREKVLDLYNKLKSGGGESMEDTAHVESIVSHQYENEINKLNKKISTVEKENRELLTDMTTKQNDFETMIQRCNILTNDNDVLKLELKRLQTKSDSLSKVLTEKDKRIQNLSSERSKLCIDMKDLQLKNLENKHNDMNKDFMTNLKSENEVLKNALKISRSNKMSSNTANVVTLQKREVDLLKEIDSLKQKIYSYKQMLKEYDILLSIFKSIKQEEGVDQDSKTDVNLDDVKIENLMERVKQHIHLCINKVKSVFADSSNVRVTEKSDNLMKQRLIDINKEKDELLNLFTNQETTYKSSNATTQKEVNLLTENLEKALSAKSALESKIHNIEKAYKDAEKTIDSMRQQGQAVVKDYEEKLMQKDKETEEVVSQMSALKLELMKLESANIDEKADLDRQKHEVQNQSMKYDNQINSLKSDLRVSEERLKLKDEEIYEIKENFERQIDELTTSDDKSDSQQESSICIIPAEGESKKIQGGSLTPRDAQSIQDRHQRYSTKYKNLQDKIHNLTDKLFQARDAILEKESEINTLRDELNRKEVNETNIREELIVHVDQKKGFQEQLAQTIKQKESATEKAKELQAKYTADTTDLKSKLEHGLKKINLLKNEIQSKSGTSMRSGQIAATDASKLIGKMLAILRKSKKVSELHDHEINELKEQVMQNLEKPE